MFYDDSWCEWCSHLVEADGPCYTCNLPVNEPCPFEKDREEGKKEDAWRARIEEIRQERMMMDDGSAEDEEDIDDYLLW